MRALLIVLAAAAAACCAALPRACAAGQGARRATDFHALCQVVASLYDLDPSLLEAIAEVESGFNPAALSAAGAEGLMQLMPETARRFRVADPYDPVDSVLGAARLLDHLERWRKSRPELELHLPEILAAYNAGEKAVESHRGVPPFAETRGYVRRVLWAYLLGGAPQPGRPLSYRAVARPSRSRDPGAVELDELARIRRERAAALRGRATGGRADRISGE